MTESLRKAATWIVTLIVTHLKPHEDELLAIWILKRWGRLVFLGIEHAKIQLVNAGLRLKGGDGYSWLVRKVLCVGVAGGIPAPGKPIFDEHAFPPEIAKRSSAATLVVQFLELLKDKALELMAAYSLWADRNSYSDPFELGALIVALNDAGVPVDQLFALYSRMADALYALLSGAATRPVTVFFREIAIRWLFRTFGAAHANASLYETFQDAVDSLDLTDRERADLREIEELTRRNEERSIEKPFNLIGIAYAMLASGVPEQQVEDTLFPVLDAKHQQYARFNAEKRTIIDNLLYLEAESSQNLLSRTAVIKSDSEEAKRAAKRVPDVDVLVQLRSTGHMQIFNLRKGKIRNLKFVAACLRMGIRDRTGRGRKYTFEELCAPGTLAEIPEVHNFMDQGHVFCGSKTAQDVPPIIREGCLTERDAIECVKNGVRALDKRITA